MAGNPGGDVSLTAKAERRSKVKNETVADEQQDIPGRSLDDLRPVSSVRFGVALTRNIGNYESLRIEIGGETQIEAGLEDEALAYLARTLLPFGEEVLSSFIPKGGKRFIDAMPVESALEDDLNDDDLDGLLTD